MGQFSVVNLLEEQVKHLVSERDRLISERHDELRKIEQEAEQRVQIATKAFIDYQKETKEVDAQNEELFDELEQFDRENRQLRSEVH